MPPTSEDVTWDRVTDGDAVQWLFSVLDKLQVTGTLDQVERQVKLSKRARQLLTELHDEVALRVVDG